MALCGADPKVAAEGRLQACQRHQVNSHFSRKLHLHVFMELLAVAAFNFVGARRAVHGNNGWHADESSHFCARSVRRRGRTAVSGSA